MPLPDDDNIDTSDIPEVGEEWFKLAKLWWPPTMTDADRKEVLRRYQQQWPMKYIGLDLGFPPQVIPPPSPEEREALVEEYRRYWPDVEAWQRQLRQETDPTAGGTTRDPKTVTEDELRGINTQFLRRPNILCRGVTSGQAKVCPMPPGQLGRCPSCGVVLLDDC